MRKEGNKRKGEAMTKFVVYIKFELSLVVLLYRIGRLSYRAETAPLIKNSDRSLRFLRPGYLLGIVVDGVIFIFNITQFRK